MQYREGYSNSNEQPKSPTLTPENSPLGSPKINKIATSLRFESTTSLKTGAYEVFDFNEPSITTTIVLITKNREAHEQDIRISYQELLEKSHCDDGYRALAVKAKENMGVLGM